MGCQVGGEKGYDTNFSAYVADLIRRDQEREDAKTPLGFIPSTPTEPNEPVGSYKTRKP